MTKTPWDALSAAVTKLGDKVAQAVEAREATVTSTNPVQVLFDTDTEAMSAHASLEANLTPGDRVLTLKLRHYVWVLGRKGGVDVHQEIGNYRGNTAYRNALKDSGLPEDGWVFFDTQQSVEYTWRGGDWVPNGKLLWEGAWYMNASQVAMLSELVSEQKNGIIVCISEYSTVAHNYNWHYFVIPKAHVVRSHAQGVNCITSVGGTPTMSRKYIYVHNDRITGQAANSNAPNNQHVLREVRGF